MKIATFSDVVFEDVSPLASRLIELSPDLIVFAGDGLNTLYSLFFLKLFDKFPPERCLFVAGNNDSHTAKNNLIELGAIEIHETPYEYDGITFLGQEGMIFRNIKAKKQANTGFKYTDKEAQKHIDMFFEDHKQTVLISHTPPLGILDFALNGGNCGSRAVKQTSMKNNVSLCIFGHTHFSGGNDIQSGGTQYVNVASHDRQQPDCARLAIIDFNEELPKIKWHPIPDTSRGKLFTIHDLSTSRTVSESLTTLKDSHAWERRAPLWDRNSQNIDNRSVQNALRIADARWLVSQLYYNKIETKLSYKLWDYDGDDKFCEFIMSEFQPWPYYLGVASLIELYEKNIHLSQIRDWSDILGELSPNLKPHFKKYIRFKTAEIHSKLVIDSALFPRLQARNLVFMDSEYPPNTSYFLTAGFKIDEKSSDEDLFLWLDHPNNKKTIESFFDQNIYDNDTFVHYAGNESHFIGNRRFINLHNEIKKAFWYPFENKKLQTIAFFLANFFDEKIPANKEFIFKDHQKVLLSTANYIHNLHTKSAAFKTLRNMCKTDIELLHYTYDAITRLENHPNVITFKTENGIDQFTDGLGNAYNEFPALSHNGSCII